MFWTSVDVNTKAVGAGKQIPVIVSSADGGFYISETITATRVNNGQKYVAIADHINSYSTFKEYTKDKTKYETLAEAYAAYKKQVEDDKRNQQYKDTLPERCHFLCRIFRISPGVLQMAHKICIMVILSIHANRARRKE